MFWFFEATLLETLAFAPEFMLLVGAPELPRRRRPRFIKVREAGRRTILREVLARD